MKHLLFICIFLLSSPSIFGKCLIEKKFAKSLSDKSLFETLEEDPKCFKKDHNLPSYHRKPIEIIEFNAYWEWRGGIASSDYGQCIKLNRYGPDAEYECHIFEVK